MMSVDKKRMFFHMQRGNSGVAQGVSKSLQHSGLVLQRTESVCACYKPASQYSLVSPDISSLSPEPLPHCISNIFSWENIPSVVSPQFYIQHNTDYCCTALSGCYRFYGNLFARLAVHLQQRVTPELTITQKHSLECFYMLPNTSMTTSVSSNDHTHKKETV